MYYIVSKEIKIVKNYNFKLCAQTPLQIGMQVLASHVSPEKWSLMITLPRKHMCFSLIDTPNSVHMVRIVELTFVAKFYTPVTSSMY